MCTSWPCVHSQVIHALWGAHICSSVSLWIAVNRNRPGGKKLRNILPQKWCVWCTCVIMCGVFCVCLSHTHELHPVLIKAGCSFYIITEFASCLQRILLLSLFDASQSSSITFTTLLFLPIALLPSVIYYTPSFSSPFPPHAPLFPSPIYPPRAPCAAKELYT